MYVLINPFVLSYVYIYVQNPKTVATPVRIYTYTDFAIEILGFYRHLTETLRWHDMRCSREQLVIPVCWQPLLRMFTNSEEKCSLVGVVRYFWRVFENYDCRTNFNSSFGMEYNGGLYGFSAVKES